MIQHPEGEIDAAGDAAGGDDVAIENGALRHKFGVEQRQIIAPRPMAGGAAALQQAGGGKDERSGTDTGEPFEPRRLRAQPAQRLLVIHHRRTAIATRHAQQIELSRLGQGERWHQRQPAIAHHRIHGLGDIVHAGTGHAAQHLGRAGHVELGELVIEQEGDAHGSGSPGSDSVCGQP